MNKVNPGCTAGSSPDLALFQLVTVSPCNAAF